VSAQRGPYQLQTIEPTVTAYPLLAETVQPADNQVIAWCAHAERVPDPLCGPVGADILFSSNELVRAPI
jgi:hypothetical protein